MPAVQACYFCYNQEDLRQATVTLTQERVDEIRENFSRSELGQQLAAMVQPGIPALITTCQPCSGKEGVVIYHLYGEW